METKATIIAALSGLGSASVKKVLLNYGAREPLYGVKIEDLKKISKPIKKNYELSLELYDSGISDAMYLAGLIADPERMTKQQLQDWADNAYWSMLNEYTVPWTAAESKLGKELALEWIDSPKEKIAITGWSTLSSIIAITPDNRLDLQQISALMERVCSTIHQSQNKVRYAMNRFVIAVGSGIISLKDEAMQSAAKMGVVTVDMNGTACKVPDAMEAIKKVEARNAIGKKRKTAKC